MNNVCLTLIAVGLCFAGMTALGLAMDRHHEQVTGEREPTRTQRLTRRGLGAMLVLLALWPCTKASGLGVGLVVWCACLTAGALLVAWTMPYRARWTTRSAALAGSVCVVALAFV